MYSLRYRGLQMYSDEAQNYKYLSRRIPTFKDFLGLNYYANIHN
jgi:hypothetical protein